MKVEVYDDNPFSGIYDAKDELSAKNLADAMFEATDKTAKVIDDNNKVIYVRQTPKNAFLELSKTEQEDKLMETSMRLMDIFCDMHYAHSLNPDKLDQTGFMEKLSFMTEWARDFEYTYYGTKEYDTEYLELTERVFSEKLTDEFGGGC